MRSIQRGADIKIGKPRRAFIVIVTIKRTIVIHTLDGLDHPDMQDPRNAREARSDRRGIAGFVPETFGQTIAEARLFMPVVEAGILVSHTEK